MQTIDVQPPSLAYAAIPLREVSESLRLVVDHRRDVLSLVASPVVRSGLERFLAAWELVGVGAAQDAMGLAMFLEQAARAYVGVDGSVIRTGHAGR